MIPGIKGKVLILVITPIFLLLQACCLTQNEKKTVKIEDIPVIDTHIHLYDTERKEGLPWPPPKDTVLYRPVLTDDFNRIAKKNGLTATVIVEASDWVEDNQWVLDLVKADPQTYPGLVGSLPLGTDEFETHLKRFSQDPRYVGIRMRSRPNGEEFFNEAVWRDLKTLADMGKTLDVLMFDFSLSDVDMVAKKLPHLKILINHVAGADIDGKPVNAVWAADLKKAASNPNVYCKVSGLFQQSHQSPSPKETEYYKPVLDALWETFGEDRLIYGSNWPVTDRGGSYAEYKHIVMDYFKPKGPEALKKLLYMNAATFYGLPQFLDK